MYATARKKEHTIEWRINRTASVDFQLVLELLDHLLILLLRDLVLQ